MLTHPTLDLLQSLNLHGMATAFRDLQTQPEAHSLDHASGWRCCSSTRRRPGARSASRPGPAPPDCVTPPASRTSTTAPPAASIARCSSSSPPATGSAPAPTS